VNGAAAHNYGAYGHSYYGWNHGGEWWHNGGWGYNRFYPIWPYSWYPWLSFGWWPDYYYYSYNPYCYDCGYANVYADQYEVPQYTTAYNPPAQQPAAPTTAEEGNTGNTVGGEYLSAALDAFHQGKYPDAMRLTGHAAVELPQSNNVHNLMMLSMFALGGDHNYRGAAMEAHVAASLGKPMDWDTLYSYYGDLQPFTTQLRALEKYVKEHSTDPAARFLLGYQYMMMGHVDAAKAELTKALIQTPRDKMAANLLTQIGGKIPESVIAIQKEMDKNAAKSQLEQLAVPKATPTPPAPKP